MNCCYKSDVSDWAPYLKACNIGAQIRVQPIGVMVVGVELHPLPFRFLAAVCLKRYHLSQLYILCWNGDDLIQHSTETAKHLYGCNWEGATLSTLNESKVSHWQGTERLHLASTYPTNKEFRQNLQIMILCSQRPVKITALKFSILSLQSFTAILSTSMSYFTLLQTVYKEDQAEDEINKRFVNIKTICCPDLTKALFEVTVRAFICIPKAKIKRLRSLILPLNLMRDSSSGISVTSDNISMRFANSSARFFSCEPASNEIMSSNDLLCPNNY
uniref:Uncharacterized protein n=1 Tax=Glossina brevipalpis TaxID=37001 RepID=A0A1A9X5P3_9MUSC